MTLIDSIDRAVAFVQEHPELMTREQVNQFKELAEQVFCDAVQCGLREALPRVPELRPELESTNPPLPPVQFIGKVNLPGDWDLVPGQDDRAFLVCASPRWLDDMRVLRALAEGDEAPLLERCLAILTPQQGKIFEHIWQKKTATFDTVRQIPNAFRDGVTNAAVVKKLKEMRSRLDDAGLPYGDIEISDASERVTLTRI